MLLSADAVSNSQNENSRCRAKEERSLHNHSEDFLLGYVPTRSGERVQARVDACELQHPCRGNERSGYSAANESRRGAASMTT